MTKEVLRQVNHSCHFSLSVYLYLYLWAIQEALRWIVLRMLSLGGRGVPVCQVWVHDYWQYLHAGTWPFTAPTSKWLCHSAHFVLSLASIAVMLISIVLVQLVTYTSIHLFISPSIHPSNLNILFLSVFQPLTWGLFRTDFQFLTPVSNFSQTWLSW